MGKYPRARKVFEHGFFFASAATAGSSQWSLLSLPKSDLLPVDRISRELCVGHVNLSATPGYSVGESSAGYPNSIGAAFDLAATDSKHAPWFVVRTDDKRRGRLNCISHILSRIPYKEIRHDKVKLPERSEKRKYDDQSSLKARHFVAERY